LRVVHLFASFSCHSVVCLARRSSICLLCSSSCCASLSISYSYVICLARPFLSPTCESLCCASFVCLSCAHFCLVVHRGRRGEEWVSDSLASWEDKRMDVVASSWRYFSTQSIISLHTPTFPHIRRPALRPTNNDHENEFRLETAVQRLGRRAQPTTTTRTSSG
jgi:hypothetical protein